MVFDHSHARIGHLNHEKVLDLERKRFYWPGMAEDIEVYTTKKCKCVMDKKPNVEQQAPMIPISSSQHFELVCIDLLHLDKCKGILNMYY